MIGARIKIKDIKAITLTELLLAVSLLSIIILYFATLEDIGTKDVRNQDRKAKVQNEVAYVLEHMAKEAKRAIGHRNMSLAIWGFPLVGFNPVGVTTSGGNTYFKVWIDYNNDGHWDFPNDRVIAWCFEPGNRRVTYYDICNGLNDCSLSGSSSPELMSNRITSVTFTPASITFAQIFGTPPPIQNNYIQVSVTGCYDSTPRGVLLLGACGTLNNPQVTMRTTINMPSVSVN